MTEQRALITEEQSLELLREAEDYEEKRGELVRQIESRASTRQLLAFAKVGMDALVDEATGYQEQRPADDLAQRLKKHGGATSLTADAK